ncbi:MAG: hypothetical protein ACYDDU_12525 [Dermatophilaceae bacterium]
MHAASSLLVVPQFATLAFSAQYLVSERGWASRPRPRSPDARGPAGLWVCRTRCRTWPPSPPLRSWAFAGSFGFPWAFAGSFGFPWAFAGSFGFPWAFAAVAVFPVLGAWLTPVEGE